MSARIDEILEVIEKTRVNFLEQSWYRSVREIRVEAAKSVALARGVQYGTITNKFRRELSPEILGVDPFDELLESWLRHGSGELQSVITKHAVGASDRERIGRVFEPPDDGDAVETTFTLATGIGQGQAFHADTQAKLEIERLAMNRAENHYRSHGWEVNDVSASRSLGFDLLCRRGAQEKHVEVKGTVSAGIKILLTRNEVKHARSSPEVCALFVLAKISVTTDGANVVASGGESVVVDPWRINEGLLEAFTYEYVVTDSRG